MELRLLINWFQYSEITLDYLNWPKRLQGSLNREEGSRRGKSHVTGKKVIAVAVFEEGGSFHEPRNVGSL